MAVDRLLLTAAGVAGGYASALRLMVRCDATGGAA
jgi:hypothetical protein